MANKKKSVKNQKKKTPQKMFPYRKRGGKPSKQNKTSKKTIQGGNTDKQPQELMSRVDRLYKTGNESTPMEDIMKNVSPEMISGMTKNLSPEMISGMTKNLSPEMISGMTKNLSPEMISGMTPQSFTPAAQQVNTNTPDDSYNTAIAEQKVSIDVAGDTVTKEISDTLCQTINRAVSSVIHYKILGSTILTQKEINTIGKFFNVDADKLSNELNSDRGIKIGNKVSFPDETMKDIIIELFTNPNTKEILYDSIPRIVNELDLPQIFYNMGRLDQTSSKSDSDSDSEEKIQPSTVVQGGNVDNMSTANIIEEDENDENDEKPIELKVVPPDIGDDLVGLDTSKDERLIGLKADIHDTVFSNLVELLNKEEDGLTLLEKQLSNHMNNELFINKISDIIVAKISYLITELGTAVVYKTLTEDEQLVPLLENVLQQMDVIKTLEEKAMKEKNSQRLEVIKELIDEIKSNTQDAVNKYIKNPVVKTEVVEKQDDADNEVIEELDATDNKVVEKQYNVDSEVIEEQEQAENEEREDGDNEEREDGDNEEREDGDNEEREDGDNEEREVNII
jgi:hypothetical protein